MPKAAKVYFRTSCYKIYDYRSSPFIKNKCI